MIQNNEVRAGHLKDLTTKFDESFLSLEKQREMLRFSSLSYDLRGKTYWFINIYSHLKF